MKAVLIQEPGAADRLFLGEYPTPEPGVGELLVKVKATALNRADIMQRQGFYPPPKGASPILGLEMAGVVERAGSNCSDWNVGDRVFGLLPGGGYAEYVTLPGAMAMRIPDNLTFEDAAAIAEVYLTAYQTLFWIGQLQAGDVVLIHAGASGVGTAAIQLVKEAGGTSIVTAGTETKCNTCLKLGASIAINYKEGPFSQPILEFTEKNGVDLVLDFVGASYWEQNLSALATDGRWVLIATLGGAKVEQVNLGMLLKKRIQFTATTLRARNLDYKIQLTRDFANFALSRFTDGRLKPIVDSIFSWKNVVDAHRYMESNQNIGKIILDGM